MLNKYKRNILMLIFSFLFIFALQGNMSNIYATDINISSTHLKVGFDGNGIQIKAENVGTSDPVLGVIEKYRDVLLLFSSLATITFGFLFILNVTKLGGAGGNPYKRQEAIGGLLICLISCGLLGGLTVILAFFQDFLLK